MNDKMVELITEIMDVNPVAHPANGFKKEWHIAKWISLVIDKNDSIAIAFEIDGYLVLAVDHQDEFEAIYGDLFSTIHLIFKKTPIHGQPYLAEWLSSIKKEI